MRKPFVSVVCVAWVACSRLSDVAPGAELTDRNRAMTGYLLIRAADCDSHLQLLDELNRSQWQGAIAVGGVVLVGPPADSAIVRRAARSYDLNVDIVANGTRRFQRFEEVVRERAVPPAPSLVLLDREGHVAMAVRSPTTRRELLTARAQIADALHRAARPDASDTTNR